MTEREPRLARDSICGALGLILAAASTHYTAPVAVEGEVGLRSFDTRGRGSRTTVVEPPAG